MQVLFIFGITLGALVLVIAGMAVGVMFGRKPIAGSCGGLNNKTNPDGSTSCSLCSQPSDACRELREKMVRDGTVDSGQDSQSGENCSTAQDACEKDCQAEGCSKEMIDACKGQ
ncbi:MAG: hypothetical protein Aurels2KO_22570 [Aureliella sp.]